MILNRSFTVKKSDVESAQLSLTGEGILTAIETVLQEQEAMFQSE
jgi:hypothetical protein